jgi:dynein heavy chain
VKHEKKTPGADGWMDEDKITMKELENSLLERLSAPDVNLIEDTELMNILDRSKKMSAESTERVKKARETSDDISIRREASDLVGSPVVRHFYPLFWEIFHMCQFSLRLWAKQYSVKTHRLIQSRT